MTNEMRSGDREMRNATVADELYESGAALSRFSTIPRVCSRCVCSNESGDDASGRADYPRDSMEK
jgi:hypothetical protein